MFFSMSYVASFLFVLPPFSTAFLIAVPPRDMLPIAHHHTAKIHLAVTLPPCVPSSNTSNARGWGSKESFCAPKQHRARLLLAATNGDSHPVAAGEAADAAAARGKQLNLACNDVVRTILRQNPGDSDAKALRARLEKQREILVSPHDEMSAIFFDNLLLVCEHELHPEVHRLRGDYAKAWRNILHYIEDAGWQLTDPPFSISG